MDTKMTWFARSMMAVTFAEANDHKTAEDLMNRCEYDGEKLKCETDNNPFSPNMKALGANS